MKSKKSRILFFIAGPVPSKDETAKASALESASAVVLFRNASACGDGDAVEVADGYAGLVPAVYRGRAPIVDEALPELPAAPAPLAPSAPVAVSPAPAAPVVATATAAPSNPPDFVPPAVVGEGAAPDAAAQRAAEDEGAKNATAAQLKAALSQLGIQFKSNASKAELLALFLNR